MNRRDFDEPRAKPAHRYAWLWEPLESDASFELRAMFGGKAVSLDGRMQLCFMAKTEPWRGVLVCTERALHDALRTEFPVLTPHQVVSKWLYLPEAADDFERVGQRLVTLALRRDARLGVESKPRKRRPTLGDEVSVPRSVNTTSPTTPAAGSAGR